MDRITTNSLKEASIRLKLEHIFEKNDRIIERCVSIGNQYGRSAQQFVEELDAFLLNVGKNTLSIDLLGRLNQVLHSKGSSDMTLLGKRNNIAVITPQQMKIQKVTELSQSNAYSARINSKQVLLSYNSDLGGRGEFHPSSSKPFGQRCILKTEDIDYDNVQQRFRYMYTSVDEKIRAVDRQLSRLQQAMCETFSIDEDTIVPVGQVSQTPVWMCGRICCETSEGRINKMSLVLEGSRRESGGRRVLLDLSDSELSPYSLFSGQIVLIYGINSGGEKVAVKKIITGVPLPTSKSSPQNLLKLHHSKFFQNGGALSTIVACGPFTTTDNLNYQPLQDLLFHVLKTKPDLLVLVGPFVDVTHPQLSSGDVTLFEENEIGEVISTQNCSYEMVFTMRVIRDCLLAMFNEDEALNLPTNIVLIPSLLDGHHEFVFPQPPFGNREAINTHFIEEPLGVLNIPFSRSNDPKQRVHLLPNPCMFRVNEILFAVNSADILFSLSTDEVNNIEEGNRLARLSSHLLQQRSFAPQHPYHSSFGLQGDWRHSSHLQFPLSPDILILPSKLTTFAKDIEHSLVINPGTLARGTAGGTFADITIHPMTATKLEEYIQQGIEEISHEVVTRSVVNIVRI